MFRALLSYFRTDAAPRSRRILISTEFFIALAAGVALAVLGSRVALGHTSAGDVVVALLGYAAIAFGFSLAGLTLVLTAPDHDFARELAWSDPNAGGLPQEPPQLNSYANLLFIFSWTALAHWVVVLGSFGMLITIGRDTPLLGHGSSIQHRVAVGTVGFLTLYAIELFVITVITLSQVGAVYIERLHKQRPPAR